MERIQEIAPNFYCIDTHDLNRNERTSAYIIVDEKITLIETSASPSIPYILDGLKQLNISLEEIDYLVVTHIHLDHAGGAGLFLEKCQNAKFVVHPKGARHMIDPSRLIESAKSVYGQEFDELFDPIVPIDVERVIEIGHEEELSLGKHKLTFYHTDGHAKHHVSIHYSATNGVFVGDTTGIYYPEMKNEEIDLIIPSTSPNQYNPDEMEQSIQLYEKLNPKELYFGHYGVYKKPEEAYRQVRYWTPIFLEEAEIAMQEATDFQERTTILDKRLKSVIFEFLKTNAIPETHPIYEVVPFDTVVSAMGLIDYLIKKGKE